MDDSIPLAVAYRLNGVNFRLSAERLKEGLELDGGGRPTNLTAVPLYYLASHAAELLLKAALLKRGFEEPKLRKPELRHNLAALLDEIRKRGVVISGETTAVIDGLSTQHLEHALRYSVLINDGKVTYWPPLSLVFLALDELLMLTRISTQGR